jgi:hypothetical protein
MLIVANSVAAVFCWLFQVKPVLVDAIPVMGLADSATSLTTPLFFISLLNTW